jgi:cytochrome b
MPDTENVSQSLPRRTVRVWDLPVRLFHWLVVGLIVLSFVTGHIGGNAMRIHELSGFSILTLVLFRVLWGLFGSTHARFSDFVRGFAAARSYAAALWSGRNASYTGHNPLGGWMVVALLLCLLVQTCTGLFANDDIMTEGPLMKYVAKEVSDKISLIHEINSYVLLVLVTLHVAAALYYLWRKRENLIWPMFTGRKSVSDVAQDYRGGPIWLAGALLTVCAVVVWFVVAKLGS